MLKYSMDPEGTFNSPLSQGRIDKEYETKPSKKACRWCEFKNTEYCSEGV